MGVLRDVMRGYWRNVIRNGGILESCNLVDVMGNTEKFNGGVLGRYDGGY